MKKILFFVLLILNFFIISEAKIVRISSNQAVMMALENNLELQAKKKDLEIKLQEVKIANELKNPQFQSNFLMGRVTRGNSSQFGGYLPIELFKRGARKELELAKLKMNENEILSYEHELKIKILKAYFNVLYAKSILKIYEDREKIFNQMKQISMQKSKNPKSDVEVMQANIKYEKQLVAINRAKDDLLSAQFILNDTLNLKDDSIMYDTQEESLFSEKLDILNIDIPSYETIEEYALLYSHCLKIADSNIELSKKDLEFQKRKVIPDIGIGAGTAYQTAHQTRSEALDGAYVGVTMDIPLLNQYKPDINKAKIVIEKSKISKEAYKSHLKIALKNNYNTFKYAKDNLSHYKTILEESQKILDLYSKKYKEGSATLLNVIQIENEHKAIVADYLGAVSAFFISYLDLMENVGHDILLDDDAL